MNIRDALLGLCFGKNYLRRKGWPDPIKLSVCNGIIYIHSDEQDHIGRRWNPTFYDLTQDDWENV